MASSSLLLAATVLAVLVAGAWCAPFVALTVLKGSGRHRITVLVGYNNHDDDTLDRLDISWVGSENFVPMNQIQDGVFKVESPGAHRLLNGPFNFRFLSKKGVTTVYNDVIPPHMEIGSTYTVDYTKPV